MEEDRAGKNTKCAPSHMKVSTIQTRKRGFEGGKYSKENVTTIWMHSMTKYTFLKPILSCIAPQPNLAMADTKKAMDPVRVRKASSNDL